MVKMWRLFYTGNTITGMFTKDKLYLGRTAKDGTKVMVRDDEGDWISVYDGRMTVSRLWSSFKEIETFTVANHREAIYFKEVSYGTLLKRVDIAENALSIISDHCFEYGGYANLTLEEMGKA